MTTTGTPREAILLVANYDSDVGYAWWLMESIWAAIARRWAPTHQVIVCYPSISKIPSAISTAPVLVSQMGFGRGGASMLERYIFLRRQAVRVLYLTDRDPVSWRYLFYRMAGVRAIVIHDHTPGERTPVTGFRRFAKAIINRIPWISADLLIGATRYVTMRHLAVNAFPAERCYTAENGIPAASSREASDLHEEFEIPRNRFIMISVGRAHRVKGISLVLAAMRELVHDRGRSDLHYVHVGDGPDLEHFKAMTDLYNIGRFVTFAGRRNDVAKIARGADLAIHASDAEVGYSLSVLECMQAGLPVIVSDAPSVSGATVPGETGLVFERGNSSSAARSIEFLLDNQACAKSLGVAAQSAAEKRFNLDQTHASVLEAIDRCAFSSLR